MSPSVLGAQTQRRERKKRGGSEMKKSGESPLEAHKNVKLTPLDKESVETHTFSLVRRKTDLNSHTWGVCGRVVWVIKEDLAILLSVFAAKKKPEPKLASPLLKRVQRSFFGFVGGTGMGRISPRGDIGHASEKRKTSWSSKWEGRRVFVAFFTQFKRILREKVTTEAHFHVLRATRSVERTLSKYFTLR